MGINQQFNFLLKSLEKKAAHAADIDDKAQVELIESSMEEILDAWTDYLVSDVEHSFDQNYQYWFTKIDSWH